MNTRVIVIDAICGAGKSSFGIQMMNKDSDPGFGVSERVYKSSQKFIYVTPFLSEVERIIRNTRAEFIQPQATKGKGSKLKHLSQLIEAGKSIVMTHVLFSRLDEDILSDIKFHKYKLIMDEVPKVIEQVKITENDFNYLLKSNAIEINSDGKITWMDRDYIVKKHSRYSDIKLFAEQGNLYIGKGCTVFKTMNIKVFTSFEEVYILTYLFDGQLQKYYFDLHDIKYNKYSVMKSYEGRYDLIDYNPLLEPRKEIEKLITLYEDYQNGKSVSRLNSNFDHRKSLTEQQKLYQLSSSWFDKATKEDLQQLNNNLRTFFKSQYPTAPRDIFWSTKKSIAKLLKNTKCKFDKENDRTNDNFVPLSIRATNDYANCTATAYVYNYFMNPMEKNFFEDRGIKVNEDMLALSELIQFLFRGCIRKGNPMNCYIPSSRMRDLLQQWFNFAEGDLNE